MIYLDEVQNRASAIHTCSCGHNFYTLPKLVKLLASHNSTVLRASNIIDERGYLKSHPSHRLYVGDYHEGLQFDCPCKSTCFIDRAGAVRMGLWPI